MSESGHISTILLLLQPFYGSLDYVWDNLDEPEHQIFSLALHTIIAGLIMSKITYALPAFTGQLTADDRNRIRAISRKAVHRGITHTAFDIEEIIDSADRKLFNQIMHQLGPCLYHLLPPKTSVYCPYSLRKRQHLIHSFIHICLLHRNDRTHLHKYT